MVSADDVKAFFAWSDLLDRYALRPLSHIRGNWETTWNHDENRYEPEEDSFAAELNETIERLSTTSPPSKYHDNEDRLAEYARDNLHWKIQKNNGRWTGLDGQPWNIDDYAAALEQGAYDDPNLSNLFSAAAGRVHAAIKHGQKHFDDMERTHQEMLAAVIANIIYHKDCGNW